MAFTSRDVEARSRVIRFIYKSKEKVKVLVDMSTKKRTFFCGFPKRIRKYENKVYGVNILQGNIIPNEQETADLHIRSAFSKS